jgi:hypothetical protein
MRDHIGVPCEPATLQRGPRSFRLEYDPQKEGSPYDQNNAFCDDGISSDAVVKQLRAEPDD